MDKSQFPWLNTKQTKSTMELFSDSQSYGVNALDASLTINGITQTPDFRYKGGDADATNWVHWDYGCVLTKSAGTAPSYNQGSPGLSSNDDSVKFNAGAYYQAATATCGDVTTEDMVFELVFKFLDETSYLISHGDATPPGWQCYVDTNNRITMRVTDSAPTSVNIVSSTNSLIDNSWNHCILFIDRSGSAQWYINGVASGSAVVVSAVGSMTDTEKLTIGNRSDEAGACSQTVSYIAMWKRAGWLDTHLQATVALERFNKFTGIYPYKAKGTATPTTQTRNTVAYLDKSESGVRKIYKVGNNWMRCVSRVDSTSDSIKGYLAEAETDNICLQSQAFDTTWSLLDGDDLLADGYTAPDRSTTGWGITAAATSGQHGVSQQITVANEPYTFSVWAKQGHSTWLYLTDQNVAGADGYFDLDNGVLGTEGAAATGYIEDWGNGWFRCGLTFTGTAADHTFVVQSAQDDLDGAVMGNGTTVETYLWGTQVELGEYMTSYIPTTTAAATRNADVLKYKGDDGNLGGSGKRGTLQCDMLVADFDCVTDKYVLSLSDGGSTNETIGQYINSSDVLASLVVEGGNTLANISDATTDVCDGTIHTIKTTYEPNSINQYVDGTAEGTPDIDTNGLMPDDLDQICIGQRCNSTTQLNGVVSNIKIYKRIV